MAEPITTMQLTNIQHLFVQWRAHVLDIPMQESIDRYIMSWNVFAHNGDDMRVFGKNLHNLLIPFYTDAPNEIYEAHRLHQEFHLLRWISYQPLIFPPEMFEGYEKCTILDYGCGAGNLSFESAYTYKKKGIDVDLVMVDIPTTITDFLKFATEKVGIKARFIDVTKDYELPKADIVVALEVWEHLYNPVETFERLHKALNPGGHLVGFFEDRQDEMFHVSTDLSALRDRFGECDYEKRAPAVWRKNG